MKRPITSALVSVFDKEGLEPVVRALHALNIRLFSTGGTHEFIAGLGIPVESVEDVTGYPAILGGRVKTLHPMIFGGILARKDNESDQREVSAFKLPAFDCVVVDLYPFQQVMSAKEEEEVIEKIDVGGVSLIRAAAKNYRDVVVIPAKEYYSDLLRICLDQKGYSEVEERRTLATHAFDITSDYDAAIHQWFAGGKTDSLKVSERSRLPLRYGENPHQKGLFYGRLHDLFDQLGGKELSYNNLLDADAAVSLIGEFSSYTAFAIIKHTNACGVAVRESVSEAFQAALEADPVSAFGGVLISNREIDGPAAESIHSLFFEVIIAPGYTEEALKILRIKTNRIILRQRAPLSAVSEVRSILNGYLFQEKDTKSEDEADLICVTEATASPSELRDLIMAMRIAKHTRSNAIVLVKDGRLCASGTGQTARIDALRQAIDKARLFDMNIRGAVMASDAFFPFPDCVEMASRAGITAIIQPGGSIRDQLSIDYCNAKQVAMYTTGIRHFRH